MVKKQHLTPNSQQYYTDFTLYFCMLYIENYVLLERVTQEFGRNALTRTI